MKKQIKDLITSASRQYATVEEYYRGLATVRLAGKKRYTGVPVIGEALVPGEKVIFDYSAATPKVYKLQHTEIVVADPLQEAPVEKPEIINNITWIDNFVSARYKPPQNFTFRSDNYPVDYSLTKYFTECVWETEPFLSEIPSPGTAAGPALRLPARGRYYINAQLCIGQPEMPIWECYFMFMLGKWDIIESVRDRYYDKYYLHVSGIDIPYEPETSTSRFLAMFLEYQTTGDTPSSYEVGTLSPITIYADESYVEFYKIADLDTTVPTNYYVWT